MGNSINMGDKGDFYSYEGRFIWIHVEYDYLNANDLIWILNGIKNSAKDAYYKERPEDEKRGRGRAPNLIIGKVESEHSIDLILMLALGTFSIEAVRFVRETYRDYVEDQKGRRRNRKNWKSYKVLLAEKKAGEDYHSSVIVDQEDLPIKQR